MKLCLWLDGGRFESPFWLGTITFTKGSCISYSSVANSRLWLKWVTLKCECVYSQRWGRVMLKRPAGANLLTTFLPSHHPHEIFTSYNITIIFSPVKQVKLCSSKTGTLEMPHEKQQPTVSGCCQGEEEWGVEWSECRPRANTSDSRGRVKLKQGRVVKCGGNSGKG